MDYSQLKDILITNIPDLEINTNFPLSSFTTVKIGGFADLFIHSKNTNQLKSILQLLYQNNTEKPYILGHGSNVLISDSNIHSVIIKNSSSIIDFDSAISDSTQSYTNNTKDVTNHTPLDPQKYLDFSSIDYSETDYPHQLLTIDSGVSLPIAINQLIDRGFTGLQWFAYIPSTIGGAVFSNIHGGSHNFSEFVNSIEVFDYASGVTKTLKKDELEWGYDFCSLQKNNQLVVLSITLSLPLGDTNLAKKFVQNWISQKQKIQPFNSLGSVFKNPSLEICQPIFGEQKSAGWIIDQLGFKGVSVGGAKVSEKHANFIVNENHATAKDYFSLIKLIQSKVQSQYGLSLETEIQFLGQF